MITINNSCQLSPFIFIINVVIGIYCNYYLYSFLFFTLFITSVIYHSNYTDFTYILDKTLCFYIVLYGTLLFYQKGREHFTLKNNNNNTLTTKILFNCKIILFLIVVISFLTVIYLYYYGYYNKKYVFNKDLTIGCWWHSFIHYISAFAHSLIMLI